MDVREKQRVETGELVVADQGVVEAKPSRRRREPITDGREQRLDYGTLVGEAGSSGKGAKKSALLAVLTDLDGEVKRQRAAAGAEIDLRSGSPTMNTMKSIALEAGVDLDALQQALAAVFRVKSFANLGNVGPARATSDREESGDFGRIGETVARDIGHDFPDVIRATAIRLAAFQQVTGKNAGRILDERNAYGKLSYDSLETTPSFVRTVWAYHSLYRSSRFFEEEADLDGSIDAKRSNRTLRESVIGALIWTVENVDESSPARARAAAYDALVYGADLLRLAPGPAGPLAEKSLAAASTFEKQAPLFRQKFLADLAEGRIGETSELGRVLDSRILVGEGAEDLRRGVIDRLFAPQNRGAFGLVLSKSGDVSIAENMELVHGLVRHGEKERAKELAQGILQASAEKQPLVDATTASAAWACLSWLTNEALTNGAYVEVTSKSAPARPIRVLIGESDLELSAQQRSVGVALAK